MQAVEARNSLRQPFIDVAVQVWRGQEHVTTISLARLKHFDNLAETAPEDVESYALYAVAKVRDAIEEYVHSARDSKATHPRAEF
jgi:hypothetical protein